MRSLFGILIFSLCVAGQGDEECSIPLDCVAESDTMWSLFKGVGGRLHLPPETLDKICEEYPAVQQCMEKELGTCDPSEVPNILILTTYFEYSCTVGRTKYKNVTNCVVAEVEKLQMPKECIEQLKIPKDGIRLFLIQLIMQSGFNEDICRVMKIMRSCPIPELNEMCGPEAGEFWFKLNTAALVKLSGSANPECRGSTTPPSKTSTPPSKTSTMKTTTAQPANGSGQVTSSGFMGKAFVFIVIHYAIYR